jgi:hypothetical protein
VDTDLSRVVSELDSIEPHVLRFIESSANQLLKEKGSQIFARALASLMTLPERLKPRSLLSKSREGAATLRIRTPGKRVTQDAVKQRLADLEIEHTGDIVCSSDGQAAFFDLPVAAACDLLVRSKELGLLIDFPRVLPPLAGARSPSQRAGSWSGGSRSSYSDRRGGSYSGDRRGGSYSGDRRGGDKHSDRRGGSYSNRRGRDSKSSSPPPFRSLYERDA